MKTPAATEITTSALDSLNSKPGNLPSRQNTVLAEVLAQLLEGSKLTGMDAVFDAHTTRLSHHIYALRRQHGWQAIRDHDVVVGTKDGRVQTISVYELPAAVIEQAMNAGARPWINGVRAARRALRAKAAQARREAERRNAARKRHTPSLDQPDLFAIGGGSHG